jgi:hypothetical protein
MANSPVDRSLPRKTEDPEERVIQEIMHDDLKTGQKNLQE